jgi:hypothetical protein
MSTLKETLVHRRAVASASDTGCYSTEAAVPTLLIQAGNGERWVLPWSHFVSARHNGDGDSERLTLLFVSHEVELQGTRLAALLPAIARFQLDSLRSLPAKYEIQGNGTEPFIERLSVRSTGASPGAETTCSG